MTVDLCEVSVPTYLIQLTPEQIADKWDQVSVAIAASLPPTVADSSNVMKTLLTSLLAGDMHCWVGVDEGKIVVVATTYILVDPIVRTKNLVLYTIYSPSNRQIPYGLWQEGLRVLQRFAKLNECDRLLAYTNVPGLVRLATNGLKGKAEYTILTWEV